MTYRLISKERDYYDSMFHVYGFDPKKIWKRKKEVINLRGNRAKIRDLQDKLHQAKKDRNIFLSSSIWIGVAGKLYQAHPKNNYSNKPYLYHGFNHNKVNLDDYWSRGSTYSPIDATKQQVIKCDEIFKEYNAPVIAIHFDQDQKIVINPILKDYNFSVVMEPFDVFNSVENYMESTLSIYREPEQVADEHRIVSAGFDLKKSFRHR